jgi:hypothetical protein
VRKKNAADRLNSRASRSSVLPVIRITSRSASPGWAMREPVHLRHAHVEDGHVEAARQRRRDPHSEADRAHVAPVERTFDRPQHAGLVVDHEDSLARHQSPPYLSKRRQARGDVRARATRLDGDCRHSGGIDRHVETEPSPVFFGKERD